MSCPPDFARLSGELGIACGRADSFVTLRDPLALANWTMPVVEALMVLGAVLALVLAIRRLRRDGDPTTLTLWIAALICTLVVDPPMLGTALAHNVFTVDLMYDRLPLYVLALYPATITLAFDTVRSMGVFERRGALVGAVCVGFVHACFYEVFDHLGPQQQWWAWNTDHDLSHPMMNSVPLISVVTVAMLGPAALAFLAYVAVGGPTARGRRLRPWSIVWSTVRVGALVPIAMIVLSLPTAVFAGRYAVQTAVFALETLAFATISVPAMFQQWRRTRHEGGTEYPSTYVRYYGALYLAVFAVLWMSALPELAGAIDGMTNTGTPTGNFGYVAACFTAALACVAGVSTLGGERERVPPGVTAGRA